MPGEQEALARRVIALAQSRPATLGLGRLVCIDGLAGSGKTTFADVVGSLAKAPVVHLDDIYPGWRGLDRVADEVLPCLRALAVGESGRYRRWDWGRGAHGAEVSVPPTPLLVLEGVGAGMRAWADLTTVLVWLEAGQEVRLQRGLERDGAQLRDEWIQWQQDEHDLLLRERTDVRADLSWRTDEESG